MDIVHHAVIGVIGLTGLAQQGQELAGLGFLAGSVLPDLDVVFMLAGKRNYLRLHQGPTHSLLLAPLLAAGLALLAMSVIGWQWAVFFGVLAGIAVHCLLDLCNTFGIQVGWPVSRRRYCLDAVFFIDAVTWVLTLGTLAVMLTQEALSAATGVLYAVLLATYFVCKLALQRRVKQRLGAEFTIPTAFNPFRFNIFKRSAQRLDTASYNALTGQLDDARSMPPADPDACALARRSALFCDMRQILRGLEITQVTRNDAGISIVANDLAIRNFGGKFGRTELQFDAKGQLQSEMAHI